jgi:hypothetical protein
MPPINIAALSLGNSLIGEPDKAGPKIGVGDFVPTKIQRQKFHLAFLTTEFWQLVIQSQYPFDVSFERTIAKALCHVKLFWLGLGFQSFQQLRAPPLSTSKRKYNTE